MVCLYSLNEGGELADNTVGFTLLVNTVADIFVDEGYVSLPPFNALSPLSMCQTFSMLSCTNVCNGQLVRPIEICKSTLALAILAT